jgi:glycyl-tRNA synthetase beta chain
MIADFLSVDSVAASRAAILSKCDLMTQMVGEFPELQGVMGRHYAISSGEPPEVAEAIGEHYSPRFSGDCIPVSPLGQIIGIADRIDTLVGIFATGMRPSGNKDPFALRRAALGFIRILLEARLELPLKQLLAFAANGLSDKLRVKPELLLEIREFLVERVRSHYREQGFGAELISAALNSDWDTLPDLDNRIQALSLFMGQDAAASLAAANKRIGNILRKSEQTISEKIDDKLLLLTEERSLFNEINRISNEITPLLKVGNYENGMLLLSGLREPVDDFFDSVMVMDEDLDLRANRLALLARLKSLFDQIADLSVL